MARNRIRFRRKASAGPPPDTGGQHDFFNNVLLTSPNYWKAYSLRPVAGTASSTSPYYEDQLLEDDDGGFQFNDFKPQEPLAFTYDYAGDSDPNKQDGAKLRMPPFYNMNNNALASDAPSASSGDSTVLSCTNVSTQIYAVNKYILLDSEWMKITARVGSPTHTITVTRGQWGTTPAAHLTGAITYRATNTTGSTLIFPLATNNEITRYLFTWDACYTTTFLDTGLDNHKAWNIRSGADAVWLEPNNTYAPSTPLEGDFDPLVNTGAFQIRSYSAVIASPATEVEPLEPVTNTFALNPNTWTRYWVLLKVRARSDAASYYDSAATLAGGGIADASVTSITLDCTSVNTVVSMFGNRLYIKIDSEILRVSGAVSGTTSRTMTVSRGQLGTTAVAHTAGATVNVCANVLISSWIADETRDPVAHFTDMPVGMHSASGATQENSLAYFEYEWNTSLDDSVSRLDRDFISYHRNWAALKGSSINPSADGLLVKPVGA